MKKHWLVGIFFLTTSLLASDEDCSQLLQTNLQRHIDEIGQLEEQYHRTLGIFSNPFDFVWKPEEGERLFARLMLRKERGDWVSGPLETINTELKIPASYNEEVVQHIIEDARSSLESQGMEQMDLQSNLLALKYAKEYLRRFEVREAVDRDGEKIVEVEEGLERSEEEPQPPRYPKMPESYQPHTKDLPEGGGKQKPFRVAEVNFKTSYFGGRYYGEILRNSSNPLNTGALPIPPEQPGKYRETPKAMILRPLGERELPLYLPSGYRPLQPDDARASIVTNQSGGYDLKLKEDLPEVTIPLIEDNGIKMMPPISEYYARPVGFPADQWPDKLQAAIRHLPPDQGKERALEIAKTIAQHISKEYLYSVKGGRAETDPVDALNAGAFQCDMAAYCMVGLLRDIYQIPSRVVGGYPAHKYKSGADEKSYMVLPSVAHAWVEVFHGGQWHVFDPTPVKKDGDLPENEKSSEYSTWEGGESEGQELAEASEAGGEVSMEAKSAQEHLQRLKENTEEGLETNLPKETAEAVDGEEMSLKDLADTLTLGSLELESKHYNPLTARAMRVFLKTVLNPNHRGEDVINMLNGMLHASKKFRDTQFLQLYQEALSIHSNNHPGLVDWVEQLIALIPKQDPNVTYQNLFQLKSSLSLYGRVLDATGPIPYPSKLLNLLEMAHNLINTHIHPDSQNIGIVEHLVERLPNVARQLLKQRYDLSLVGPNAPTMKVAKALKSGKLNDLRLMAILNPLTDFILNASPRPESVEVKQWQENNRRPRGRDLLPLTRPSDITRALVNRPGMSLQESIQPGAAFVPVRRQTTRIPLGHGKDEAERITIVLYDTSGSMSGAPGDFQAGLISSFTAKALSDVSRSGRHRHRVVLVPFDSVPGTPVSVTNTAQALDIIDNYRAKLANTGGGTAIQSALMQAMSLIADAEMRAGEPLAAANIILMTDGLDDNIDLNELYRARSAIDRETPLQTMFVAIGESNPTLMEFAMNSRRAGMEKGFYREFRQDHIEDILQESRNSDFKGEDYFYTDVSADILSREIHNTMESALKEANIFSHKVRSGNRYTSAGENLDRLRKLKWHNIAEMERPLETWLIELRVLANTPIFQDRRALEAIVDDLIVNFSKITGFDLNTLGDHEQEQLRHLVRYAAGLEDAQ